jgi:hypothetical protein
MGDFNTSKTNQNQQQQTSQTAWQPTLGSLQGAIGGLNTALGQSQAGNAGTQPTGFVAGLDPSQIANFNQMLAYGNLGNPVIGTQQQAGSALTQTGLNGTNDFLSRLSSYNPSASLNPGSVASGANTLVQGYNIPAEVQNAMLAGTQNARDVLLPGIDQAAAASGNANSSRAGLAQGVVARGLAEQAAGLSGSLQNQAYGSSVGTVSDLLNANNSNQLSALNAGGSLGLNAANIGTNALNSSVNNAGSILGIGAAGGAGLQQGQQDIYNNQIAANQFATQNPFSSYSQYLPLLESIAGTGSQGTQNTQTQQSNQASLSSTLGGILGAGGSLLGGTGAYGTSGLGGVSGLQSLLKNMGIGR